MVGVVGVTAIEVSTWFTVTLTSFGSLNPDASMAVIWKTYEPACENVACIRFVMVVTVLVADGAAPFNCTFAPDGALMTVQL